jgi:hypothetical protein
MIKMDTIPAALVAQASRTPAAEPPAISLGNTAADGPSAMCEVVRLFNDERLARGWKPPVLPRPRPALFAQPAMSIPFAPPSHQGQSGQSMHAAQRRALAERTPKPTADNE